MSAATDFLTLRNALVKARADHGMTQQAVARKLGVTRQALSAWEQGVNFPSADMLFAWATVVGVRIVPLVPPSELERAIARCSSAAVEVCA